MRIGSFNGVRVELLEGGIMPSAKGYARIYILSEGGGKYILGQKFGSSQAPCFFGVEEGDIFGFIPESKTKLFEISMGEEELTEGEIIDLRHMEHGVRHPLVMKKFSELKKGESFYIINDHDPLPLYFQMSFAFPKKVGWEYVEVEEGFWKIRISKIKE
ncbi:DUF2249 domain-containing protein [Hydrogenobacter hydrogenophilus]|uniref:Uncharacterized conserved protein, DUF2249 family n=1 Tax=Hydrogenobacter hydrogenophilus TaxID=35835 RepID=A0A285NY27_9AQUI|nr:DUF2249 domain-containing protein [Hydrogenobacter hydrogenophilus]SNZ14349.1 Uncharacterized conserved protein, DUF2249 family [Hydrogenobacter hydrogenophilus]